MPTATTASVQGRQAVGINQHIGQRPIVAFGNPDGDLHSNGRPPATARALCPHRPPHRRRARMGLRSPPLAASTALNEAQAKGWTVVDMERDWKRVFAFKAK